jgi:branched-chain amino acid aminotransferase
VAAIVSLDGEIVPPERAVISVLDRGVLYGDGAFEVLRAWRGRMPDLDAHLDRLAAACATLGLHAPPRDRLTAWVATAVATAVAAGPSRDLRVRIVVTRGSGPLASRLATLGPGRTIVVVEPLPAQPQELSLAVVDWPLPARRGPGVKVLAYLDHVIARELAAAAGADEAVRLDAAGGVAECATANLFIVRDGAVATPRADAGVLPGIVRGHAIALCARFGVACSERQVELAELTTADEVFVTSSLRGIVAVTRIADRHLTAGTLTARLAAAYRAARDGL